MARYIDADALTEHIQKLKVGTDDWFGMGIARGIERAETAIQMQPTADVVPKSEVAREIFAEIEEIKFVGNPPLGWLKQYTELKKKYTEDQP